eukprot:14110164-Heterocapsa_arctica.AAC.1
MSESGLGWTSARVDSKSIRVGSPGYAAPMRGLLSSHGLYFQGLLARSHSPSPDRRRPLQPAS